MAASLSARLDAPEATLAQVKAGAILIEALDDPAKLRALKKPFKGTAFESSISKSVDELEKHYSSNSAETRSFPSRDRALERETQCVSARFVRRFVRIKGNDARGLLFQLTREWRA